MNKKLKTSLITYYLIATTFLNTQDKNIVDFYDISFLQNTPIIENILKERGFFEVNFKTHDNLTINSIMLDQSNKHEIKATIISFPGFFPGSKEAMTTLYAMLESQPYNFLFIDSRGHGKSDGELLTFNGIKSYGEKQYLDMTATIKFVVNYNKKNKISENIIIHGLCAGAFHTVKAINHLKKEESITYNHVKGIIFDSGWPSIIDIIETIIEAESVERCKNYGISFLQPCLAYIIHTTYNLFFKSSHSQQTPLQEAISEIDQPIFFIHAEEDNYVPIDKIHPLIKLAKNPYTWFVKNSSHVNNHLQHKKTYANQIKKFILSVL